MLAVLLAGGVAADGAPPTLYCLEVTKEGHPHPPRGVSNGTPLKPFPAQLADVRCRHCGAMLVASSGARAIADHLLTCRTDAPG